MLFYDKLAHYKKKLYICTTINENEGSESPLFFVVTEKKIMEILEPALNGTDLFLVQLNVDSANRIYIEVDSDSGITIDGCVKVSRLVEGSLDRETCDFELQVTSPGADKPLRVFRQYRKSIGRNLNISLKNSDAVFTAKLVEVRDGSILVIPVINSGIKGRKPKLSEELKEIPFNEIKQTNIILSFN